MSKKETDKQYIARMGKKYPNIVEHGNTMGSYAYYIAIQLSLAEQDKAPANTTYKKEDGTWAVE